MKIAIIGTGALGSLLAAKLGPDNDLIIIGRWAAQIEAIHTHGLTLVDSDGGRSVIDVATTGAPESQAGAWEIALVAVKSRTTEQAAADAAVVLAEDGLGVTLQNGVGNLPVLQRTLGAARATLGITAQGATIVAPGIVRHAGTGPTTIGRPAALGYPASALAEALCRAFNTADMPCTVAEDTDELVWAKLAVNAAINPLTCLLGVPNGALLEDPDLVTIMDVAAREVAAVAQAQGIALDGDQLSARARQVAHDTASNLSSMLQDINRGAGTEIDAICGAVVAAGSQYGTPVPINVALLRLVKDKELGVEMPDMASVVSTILAANA